MLTVMHLIGWKQQQVQCLLNEMKTRSVSISCRLFTGYHYFSPACDYLPSCRPNMSCIVTTRQICVDDTCQESLGDNDQLGVESTVSCRLSTGYHYFLPSCNYLPSCRPSAFPNIWCKVTTRQICVDDTCQESLDARETIVEQDGVKALNHDRYALEKKAGLSVVSCNRNYYY